MFKIKTQSLLEEAYCLLREIEKRKQAGRRDLDQYEIHIKKEIRRYNKAQQEGIIGTIINVCRERQISTVCVGKPNIQLFSYVRSALRYKRLLNNLAILNIDLIILGS